MSCFMAFGLMVSPAYAVVSYEPTNIQYEGEGDDRILKSMDIGPYTFVNSDEWIEGDTELSVDNLGKVADHLSKEWGPIAGSILSSYSPVTIDSRHDNTQWKTWYGPNKQGGGTTGKKDGYSVDVIDAFMGRTKRNIKDSDDQGLDRYNRDGKWRETALGDPMFGPLTVSTYMTSGLQYATSMDDILREMCDMSATAYSARTKDDTSETINARKDKSDKLYALAGKDGEGLSWMKDSDSRAGKTQAFYRIVSSQAFDDKLFSNNYALIFYDFQLSAVGTDDVDMPVVSYNDQNPNIGDGGENQHDYVENRSQNNQNESFSISNSVTESLKNTFTSSKTVSHGSSIGVSVSARIGGGPDMFGGSITTSFSTNWSEAVQTGYSEESQIQNSSSTSSATSVTIPPHTVVEIEKRAGTRVQTLEYKCPTVLNYKVAVVGLCYRPSDPDYAKTFSTRFGCEDDEGGYHATQNLYVRAVDSALRNRMERAYGQVSGHYGDYSVSGIEWDKVANAFDNDPYDTAGCIQRAATQLPLFTSGATMVCTTTSTKTALGSIRPIHPLTTVKLLAGDADKRHTIAVGDSLSLASIKVGGYNDWDVAYYGFDPDKGTWALCDEYGNLVDASDYVELDYDEGTDSLEVIGKAAGIAYLKWVLADGVSYQAQEGEAVTKTQNAPKTPEIRIEVTRPVVDLTGYRVDATGSATVRTNEKLNLQNCFTAEVYDAGDSLVSDSVRYVPRDVRENSNVSIDDNNVFVATQEGDYLVAATYTIPGAKDGAVIKSDWLTVHVTPAPVVEDVVCEPAELSMEGGKASVILLGQHLYDGILVTLTDKNGIQVSATTSGTDTEQRASFELPQNDVFDEDMTYAVSYEINEVRTDTDKTVTVRANTLTAVEAVEPTCTKAGNKAHWKCNETGKLYDDEHGSKEITPEDTVIEALGHELVELDGVPATCTADGSVTCWRCSRCEKCFHDKDGSDELAPGEDVLHAKGHAWDDGVVTVEPTCEEAGELTITCANDKTHTQVVQIPALGHAWNEGVVTVEPTCEDAGELTITCANDNTHTQVEPIPALGHDWDEWRQLDENVEERVCKNDSNHKEQRGIPAADHVHALESVLEVAPTCTVDGNTAYEKCTTCGRLFTDATAEHEINTEDVVVKATGHDWDMDNPTEVVEATCVRAGNKRYPCKNECGEFLDVAIPKLMEHTWDEGVQTTAATCTSAGETTYTCTVDGCGVTKVEDVPAALDHAWDEGTVTTEATCEEEGEKVFTCANNPRHARVEVIPALGHLMSDEGIVSVQPTCTTEGTRIFECLREGCDKQTSETLPALGHDWDEGTVTTAATCTKNGVLTFVCKNDPTHTKTQSIAKLGHEWGAWKKASSSKHRRVCTHDASHVQTAAHTWDEGRVTVKPTYLAKGVRTFTCSDCGATKTQSIAKKKAPLLLGKMLAKGTTSLKLSWNKISGADGYDVYITRCGSDEVFKWAKTVRAGESLTYTKTRLSKNKCYKAKVRAFVWVGSKKTYIKTSNIMHGYTGNGNKYYTNAKAVTANKTKMTVKVGKIGLIKAQVTKVSEDKELVPESHAVMLRYTSSDTSVAKVDYAGRVTGVSAGTCKVYVYAANGVRTAVTVTVK